MIWAGLIIILQVTFNILRAIKTTMEEEALVYVSVEREKKRSLLKLLVQLFHLAIAAVIFLVGVVEFSVELTIFDVFGKGDQRSAVPKGIWVYYFR